MACTLRVAGGRTQEALDPGVRGGTRYGSRQNEGSHGPWKAGPLGHTRGDCVPTDLVSCWAAASSDAGPGLMSGTLAVSEGLSPFSCSESHEMVFSSHSKWSWGIFFR